MNSVCETHVNSEGPTWTALATVPEWLVEQDLFLVKEIYYLDLYKHHHLGLI
jgi:hypothetical protein